MAWTFNEIDCLKRNFPTMRTQNLAKIIGKSSNALIIKASRLGIKKEISLIRVSLNLTPIEEQLVIGGLLGDLYAQIPKTSKYARLQGAHGEKQKEYVLWKINLMKRFRFRLRKTKINAYWYESKSFKALNQYYYLFYGKGAKQVNTTILNLLDDFGLLIWYLDDGSYNKRDRNCNLHTNCFSYPEQELIQNWFLQRYNLCPKIYSSKDPKNYPDKEWYFIHFNVKDTKKLLEVFNQFEVPECMRYKLGLN